MTTHFIYFVGNLISILFAGSCTTVENKTHHGLEMPLHSSCQEPQNLIELQIIALGAIFCAGE